VGVWVARDASNFLEMCMVVGDRFLLVWCVQ
jgi:hypothetical protein